MDGDVNTVTDAYLKATAWGDKAWDSLKIYMIIGNF
jgi:hypothetical protein